MASLGDELRAARESRRLSIPGVSEQIHIRSVYLQAIEEESWSAIAAPVYVRGFIRTYARFLGLDAEEAVARFNGVVAEPEPDVKSNPKQNRGIFPQWGVAPLVWMRALGVAAVMLVCFVGYDYYRLQKSTQAAILAEAIPTAQPPAASARDEPRPAQRSKKEQVGKGFSANGLEVKVEQRSWLRVVLDGRDVMEGVFEAGTQRAFAGKTATVRAGNAGGVVVAINGKETGALGPLGDVVERTFSLAQ
jgi:cytoskeleton protein RodZ